MIVPVSPKAAFQTRVSRPFYEFNFQRKGNKKSQGVIQGEKNESTQSARAPEGLAP